MHMSSRLQVTVRIYGGLGNQLFMYAFARGLSIANGVDLLLDTASGFVRDPFHRRCMLGHFHVAGGTASRCESYTGTAGIVRRMIDRQVNHWLPLQHRWYLQERTRLFDPSHADLRLRRSVYVEGYWQSAEYVQPISDVLRDDLAFAWQPGDAVRRLAETLEHADSVCVHVRRYLSPATTAPSTARDLPAEYYDRAIDAVRQIQPAARFHVFTDQPQCGVVDHLVAKGCRLVAAPAGPDRDIADFWLMTRCRHFVVANSTYSWWAAWLGQHSRSVVVAPARDDRVLNTVVTTPASWIRVAPYPGVEVP